MTHPGLGCFAELIRPDIGCLIPGQDHPDVFFQVPPEDFSIEDDLKAHVLDVHLGSIIFIQEKDRFLGIIPTHSFEGEKIGHEILEAVPVFVRKGDRKVRGFFVSQSAIVKVPFQFPGDLGNQGGFSSPNRTPKGNGDVRFDAEDYRSGGLFSVQLDHFIFSGLMLSVEFPFDPGKVPFGSFPVQHQASSVKDDSSGFGFG
jgi:hypothetical protein